MKTRQVAAPLVALALATWSHSQAATAPDSTESGSAIIEAALEMGQPTNPSQNLSEADLAILKAVYEHMSNSGDLAGTLPSNPDMESLRRVYHYAIESKQLNSEFMLLPEDRFQSLLDKPGPAQWDFSKATQAELCYHYSQECSNEVRGAVLGCAAVVISTGGLGAALGCGASFALATYSCKQAGETCPEKQVNNRTFPSGYTGVVGNNDGSYRCAGLGRADYLMAEYYNFPSNRVGVKRILFGCTNNSSLISAAPSGYPSSPLFATSGCAKGELLWGVNVFRDTAQGDINAVQPICKKLSTGVTTERGRLGYAGGTKSPLNCGSNKFVSGLRVTHDTTGPKNGSGTTHWHVEGLNLLCSYHEIQR